MRFWIFVSRSIDTLTRWIGRQLGWLVLLAAVISAGNAVVRKAFDSSSNALLEVQWYLFAAIFLLAAGYTMLHQEHVKIDVFLSRLSRRNQVRVELFGIAAFLMPFVATVIFLVWPIVARAWVSSEVSSNAGGLIRWPVYALVPIGFFLLGIQGVSEFIKRVAFLRGLGVDPALKEPSQAAAAELAEVIKARAAEDRP